MSNGINVEAILHARLQAREFKDMFIDINEIPSYVKDNLKHDLREYQEGALQQFMFTQETDVASLNYKYLLFHMATGSGKTVVMASTILYMYKKHGYQNFLFFVNSDAIVKKTIDNLTNEQSPKYLFNEEGIVIDGNRITIKVVDTFPALPAQNTIYLILTGIQKLHGDLNDPVENGLTYDDLSEVDIVMLGDEAHHYFAETKRGKKKLTAAEEKVKSWEETLNKILSLRSKNRMFGFSATLNLKNDLLFEKMKDKVVYQYDLGRFMDNGFSKNVVLLRANEDDKIKMLHAILLSQYRKYIARDNGIRLKPVIMFKSNTISISEQAYQTLLNIIENITINQLQQIIRNGNALYENENTIWNKMFSYYKDMNLADVINDLQWEFTDETILNVNSKVFLSEQNALRLNSLEEEDNPTRVVFQIAKLNEGWDVLNLFDIVRISEGASSTPNTTDSEAQLIGRGARYFPFEYKGEGSFKRRFDEVDTELKAIETLHYHTINENTYIKNLHKSLDKAKIQVMDDGYEKLEAKLKTKFKKSNLFKSGKIYINERVPTTIEDYKSLEKYNVVTSYEIPLETGIEQKYGDEREIVSTINVHEVKWKVEQKFIQKAIQRNPFFHFSNLKEYVPAITSVKDFIESPDFLGDLKLHITLPYESTLSDLTAIEKIKLVDRFFSYMEDRIRLNYNKEKGTPIFKGYAFNELIDDYYLHVNKVQSNKVNQKISKVQMKDHKWYIYDFAIMNGLEAEFLDFIRRTVRRLEEKYNEVYLIRNERKVKVTEIGGVRGFMPDFLLYLKDENFTYQVFIEPKGKHLSKEDEWKQKFLMELTERKDIEILNENDDVRLIGIKFYSSDEHARAEFREDFEVKLLN